MRSTRPVAGSPVRERPAPRPGLPRRAARLGRADRDARLPLPGPRNTIKNRPADEVHGQLRYGSEESWKREHPVGRDVAGVDANMLLGIDLADGVILGLDANLWDPLPMGISFYATDAEIELAKASEWHVWEKINRAGTKRSEPRSPPAWKLSSRAPRIG